MQLCTCIWPRYGASYCGADRVCMQLAVVVHSLLFVVQNSPASPSSFFLPIDNGPVAARVEEKPDLRHYLLQQQYLNSAKHGVPRQILSELQDLVPREPPKVPADDPKCGLRPPPLGGGPPMSVKHPRWYVVVSAQLLLTGLPSCLDLLERLAQRLCHLVQRDPSCPCTLCLLGHLQGGAAEAFLVVPNGAPAPA